MTVSLLLLKFVAFVIGSVLSFVGALALLLQTNNPYVVLAYLVGCSILVTLAVR